MATLQNILKPFFRQTSLMTHGYNCGAQQQAPYLGSSICQNFSCRAITTNEQQMKQVSHMVGVTHSEVVAATTLLACAAGAGT